MADINDVKLDMRSQVAAGFPRKIVQLTIIRQGGLGSQKIHQYLSEQRDEYPLYVVSNST
jgi:hypothetical protein